MRKTIAAVAVAGSLAAGGLAGSVIGPPAMAAAAETAGGAAGWVREALGGLVDDGTITQEQADAVATALEDARPERPHHRLGMHLDLADVANALGMTPEELRAAHRDHTIAEIAAAEGVEVEAVVDALVGALGARLAERVAAGDLTEERAEELLARAEDRISAFVDGEGPAFRHGPRGRRGVERAPEASGTGI